MLICFAVVYSFVRYFMQKLIYLRSVHVMSIVAFKVHIHDSYTRFIRLLFTSAGTHNTLKIQLLLHTIYDQRVKNNAAEQKSTIQKWKQQ